jgi:hypothetical protein
MADLSRPARRIARSKPAGQDKDLNVSKVASNSSAAVPGAAHLL